MCECQSAVWVAEIGKTLLSSIAIELSTATYKIGKSLVAKTTAGANNNY